MNANAPTANAAPTEAKKARRTADPTAMAYVFLADYERLVRQHEAMVGALRSLLEMPLIKILPRVGTGPVDNARDLLAQVSS